MKFTNVKQLIIKFMGGGLINFPTRFLRWVKINGDTDGSDDGGGGSGDSESLLMSLIPDNYPKPDLFVFIENPEENPEDNNIIDVTNYKIDDFLNLYNQEETELNIMCLYQSSNLSAPIVNHIIFVVGGGFTSFNIGSILGGSVLNNEFYYNNKLYYNYSPGGSPK